MNVDISTDAVIRRPIAVVAAYASDPNNAPAWYVNISAVKWQTEPMLGLGSRVAFVAQFLGRRMAYVYEIVDWVPNRRLVMRTTDGPFPMETIYTWEQVDEFATRMTLRNHGSPSGFGSLTAPLVAMAMRRANRSDLARLTRLLEGPITRDR